MYVCMLKRTIIVVVTNSSKWNSLYIVHTGFENAWQTVIFFKCDYVLQGTLCRDTLLHARNGKRMRALDIFSKALEYLKDKALEAIHKQSGVEYTAEEVLWVVTVPAIWKQSAKQFMREAAYEVGLPRTTIFYQKRNCYSRYSRVLISDQYGGRAFT